MTETASIHGPVAADVPQVAQRLQQLAGEHHRLLGEALAHLFGTTGKRIRPALVLLSGKLGEYDLDRLVTLAASIELVHSATLVHDDTVDNASSRRGLATINVIWDGKVAILIGDFLFAQSAELAAQLDSVPIIHLLSQTVMSMSRGELQQYAATQTRALDEDDYLQRIAGKTASLFAMCCEGGAIVSRQSPQAVEALRLYGINLGMAFQIADDVLDFEGDEATLGKPAGNDLRQGTLTLPLILLCQDLPPQSPVFRALENDDYEFVLESVRESDTLERSRQRAGEYAAEARKVLDIFPEGEAKEALLHLTEYVISRKK